MSADSNDVGPASSPGYIQQRGHDQEAVKHRCAAGIAGEDEQNHRSGAPQTTMS